MSKRGCNILIGAIALMLGGLLYVLFRDNSYIAGSVGNLEFVVHTRKYLSLFDCAFLRFYFPDFLWGLSLGCGLQAIYIPGVKGTVVCGCIAFLCGCIWESLQCLGAINGTADLLDVLMYLLAGLVSIFVNLKERVK